MYIEFTVLKTLIIQIYLYGILIIIILMPISLYLFSRYVLQLELLETLAELTRIPSCTKGFKQHIAFVIIVWSILWPILWFFWIKDIVYYRHEIKSLRRGHS